MESDIEREYEELEEERLKATDLPLCIVKCILTRNKGQSERLESDWKRTNIFHTRVVHGNKALNVIIDNGSRMNVISNEASERLGLPQEIHPTLYRVSWINDSNSIPVKHRFLVKFSLGKRYTDEVWCDVLPMSVCHLLLGRSWLYRLVLYDGYDNTYSFKFQNKKIVLEPLLITEFQSSKESSSVLTLRAFTKSIQQEPILFVQVG